MNHQTTDPAPSFPKFRPLRTWPALLLVALMFVTRFGPIYLEGGMSSYWMVAMFGPLLCCVLIVIWWLTASRATWKERLFGFAGLIASMAATWALVDPTMRGPGTIQLTLPMGLTAFALGVMSLAGHRPAVRTSLALLFGLAGFGFSILLRNEGATGDYLLSTHWRWSQSPEESMLAARVSAAAVKPDPLDPGKMGLALARIDHSLAENGERKVQLR